MPQSQEELPEPHQVPKVASASFVIALEFSMKSTVMAEFAF
jgi:hypothetical protein